MKHKVAVIGAGYFGQRHIQILSQMPDVEITGIVDTDINRAREIAEEYGLKYFDNYRYLLNSASVFFIVTPTNTHFDIAMDLVKKGKDLFIEKPLTERPELAMNFIKEAMNNNIIFQVGMIERYNPAVMTLLGYVDNPIFIKAERSSPFLGRATDTDVSFDLMIHDLDLLWMILKKAGTLKIEHLKVFKKSLVTEKIDFAAVWIDLLSNNIPVTANLTASRISSNFRRVFMIIQKKFLLHADLMNRTVIRVDRDGKLREIPVRKKDVQPLYTEIRDFLNSVRERRLSSYAPTAEEIIEVLEIINTINGGNPDETFY